MFVNEIKNHFGVYSFDRRSWGFSWWSACWLPVLCREWHPIAPLPAGFCVTAGNVSLSLFLSLCLCLSRYLYLSIDKHYISIYIYLDRYIYRNQQGNHTHISTAVLKAKVTFLCLPVCSGSNTLRKGSCVRWLGSSFPSPARETGEDPGGGEKPHPCVAVAQPSSSVSLLACGH